MKEREGEEKDREGGIVSNRMEEGRGKLSLSHLNFVLYP